MQILIQSKKEDISTHISSVKFFTKKESKKINEISEKYIDFLNNINSKNKSATKNYYIIIKYRKKTKNKKEELNIDIENLIFEELNDQYIKIKESISRCGNRVVEIIEKNEIKKILFSFFYPKNIKFGGDVN